MAYFGGIVPCGLEGKKTTSVAALGGDAPTVEEAARAYSAHFERALDVRVEWAVASHLVEFAG